MPEHDVDQTGTSIGKDAGVRSMRPRHSRRVRWMLAVGVLTVFAVVYFIVYGFVGGNVEPRTVVSTSSDMTKLMSQLNIPPDAADARWRYSYRFGGGVVPSPGRATIAGRFSVSADAMKRLRDSGEWREAALPEKDFGDQILSVSSKTGVLHNVSRNPGDEFIYGTTWMRIDLYIDEKSCVVYFLAEKS
ncbi:MAG: hypothetical protein IBJ18_14095 [Phycisphaerales bacterium]|nr:hypothetical protein [Phycisphaerales bacterium]